MKNWLYSIAVSSLILFTGCQGIQAIPPEYKPISTTQNAKGEEIPSNIYVKHNQFSGNSFYQHKRFLVKEDAPAIIYISGLNNVMLRLQYYGSDWIFFDHATFINDKKNRLYLTFENYNKNTDVLSGSYVKETVDIHLTNEQREKLKQIFSSNSVSLRLSGKYYHDYQISREDILAIRELLDLDLVKNTISNKCMNTYQKYKSVVSNKFSGKESKEIACNKMKMINDLELQIKKECSAAEFDKLYDVKRRYKMAGNFVKKYCKEFYPNF